MIDSTFFLLLLTAHIIGDFYLQTDKIAQNKDNNKSYMWLHFVAYAFIFGLAFIVIGTLLSLILIGTVVLLHGIIDYIKIKLVVGRIFSKSVKDNENNSQIILFIFDQAIHILVIIIISIIYQNIVNKTEIVPWVREIFAYLNFPGSKLLRGVLLILMIYKPVNIAFIKLFNRFKPKINSEEDPSQEKGGATIGFLERLIIIIFLYAQEYSAIGFILAAKSIVRYAKITEKKEFGEYYLIGTLFSTICALVLFYLIWK